MKVEVDGQEIFDGQGLVFVGNISRYAVGLQILHHADFGDGLKGPDLVIAMHD